MPSPKNIGQANMGVPAVKARYACPPSRALRAFPIACFQELALHAQAITIGFGQCR
jgi:hypothetical protein